ncbi:hypothetical protein CBER1_10130 [Cercospora berteroae]|uniref:Uncharacterized protein n=1 Tax=Cercospora berteroae TaxID=357750 RepID=A0A2S6CKC1_9PEZI|nr:hypothetical protein CBER1_10130 [Cercospora berteroae]
MGKPNPLPLCRKLEQLPQELYDHIYNLTFTADSRIRYFGHPDRPDAAMKVADHFSLHPTDDSGEEHDITPFPRDHLFYVDRASRLQYTKFFFQSVLIHGCGDLDPFLKSYNLNIVRSLGSCKSVGLGNFTLKEMPSVKPGGSVWSSAGVKRWRTRPSGTGLGVR